MTDSVIILGNEYSVKKFTKAHLASLVYAFRRAITPSGQSQLGETLKRFFIPSIPPEIVDGEFDDNTQTWFYTIYLDDFGQMGEVLEDIISIAKKRGVISIEDTVETVSIELDDDEDETPPVRKLKATKTVKKGE